MVGALNSIAMGLVSVLRGQSHVGIQQIRRGIELVPESLNVNYEHYLALGLLSDGRPNEAFSTLTRALEWSQQNGGKNRAGSHAPAEGSTI